MDRMDIWANGKSHLYRSSASSTTFKLSLVWSCTFFSLSVAASVFRNAVTLAWTFAHSAGRRPSPLGIIVSVRPWSSLRIPSRDSGITMLRHTNRRIVYATSTRSCREIDPSYSLGHMLALSASALPHFLRDAETIMRGPRRQVRDTLESWRPVLGLWRAQVVTPRDTQCGCQTVSMTPSRLPSAAKTKPS